MGFLPARDESGQETHGGYHKNRRSDTITLEVGNPALPSIIRRTSLTPGFREEEPPQVLDSGFKRELWFQRPV